MLPCSMRRWRGDQLPERAFEPPLPSGNTLHLWGEMADLAARYWNEVVAARSSAEEAALAGFADQSYMTRALVRQFGITPGRYAAAIA